MPLRCWSPPVLLLERTCTYMGYNREREPLLVPGGTEVASGLVPENAPRETVDTPGWYLCIASIYIKQLCDALCRHMHIPP